MRSGWEILQKLSKVERQYLLSLTQAKEAASIHDYEGWHHALEWVSIRGDQVIVDGVVGKVDAAAARHASTFAPLMFLTTSRTGP
ncbi:MAG: hypothetical protein QXG52_08200 [Candidatus Caldarchaeum sp.]